MDNIVNTILYKWNNSSLVIPPVCALVQHMLPLVLQTLITDLTHLNIFSNPQMTQSEHLRSTRVCLGWNTLTVNLV